ncbi:TRAP transporter small permease [Paenibacillus alginolyticus]|uniref:TRAP transporter small permease n=1 Tax=Paenibacillus alginolyticus TaxID=59839 RepID=UPI0004036552|nr:TRAP transporter small permease [Paenibacillus alginolyticus]MCY9670376.1 TRAP transporter small permease [Paenibacillus alginolyticus]
MEGASKFVDRVLNGLIAFSLLSMSILVFGNVVLRYAFNSGITWSEEMSRYFFIWMIFLGAIPALKDNEHLGVDMLIKKLPARGKKIVYVISNLLILYALWLVTDGGWALTQINMDSTAPATGLPLYYVSGIILVMGIGMAIIVLFKLYKVLFTKTNADDLILTTDSEELLEFEPTRKAN